MFISINLWFIWIEAQAGIFIIFYIFIIFVADEDMERGPACSAKYK